MVHFIPWFCIPWLVKWTRTLPPTVNFLVLLVYFTTGGVVTPISHATATCNNWPSVCCSSNLLEWDAFYFLRWESTHTHKWWTPQVGRVTLLPSTIHRLWNLSVMATQYKASLNLQPPWLPVALTQHYNSLGISVRQPLYKGQLTQ